MRKRKSSIIPLGDFEKVYKQDKEKFDQEFYKNPLIPWWIKAAYALSPVPLHKPDRADTWCKLCGRKHDKRAECESLRLVEDLTEPPMKRNKDGELIANRKIGYYTTRPRRR